MRLASVAAPALLALYCEDTVAAARELALLPAEEGASVTLLRPFDDVVWARASAADGEPGRFCAWKGKSSGDWINRVAAAPATILITWPDFEPDGPLTGRRLTDAGHRLRVAPKRTRRTSEEMVRLVDGVHAAIVSTDPFDAAVLESASRLRVIARVGVGTDSIDLDAAARHNVAVCTTPGANTASTADHTVALMLAALRRVAQHDRAIRHGGWERTGAATGWELGGSTVGLVGYGAIGRQVRRRLSGFGVHVLVCDPFLGRTPGVQRVTLDQLLADSDVVSLHLPLTDATRGLLDRRRLALLRPHAVLVNTARGGLVDEDALADALECGALRAAALDVLAFEPPGQTRLSALDNVVLTPHVAGLSVPSVREMTRRATDDVLAVLSGREPAGRVSTSEVTPA